MRGPRECLGNDFVRCFLLRLNRKAKDTRYYPHRFIFPPAKCNEKFINLKSSVREIDNLPNRTTAIRVIIPEA